VLEFVRHGGEEVRIPGHRGIGVQEEHVRLVGVGFAVTIEHIDRVEVAGHVASRTRIAVLDVQQEEDDLAVVVNVVIARKPYDLVEIEFVVASATAWARLPLRRRRFQ
jgi:hypothetical protein